MSKENPPQDWEQLWIEYNKSFKTWMEAFKSLQMASNDVQLKYNKSMIKALKDSNDKTMSQFIENWQRSMIDAGITAFKQFDNVGNSANAQKVIIKTSGQKIDDLITLGSSMDVNAYVLKDASKILNDSNLNNYKTACGKLSMFINQVNQNHKLTSLQKAQLIESANAIKTSIGCK